MRNVLPKDVEQIMFQRICVSRMKHGKRSLNLQKCFPGSYSLSSGAESSTYVCGEEQTVPCRTHPRRKEWRSEWHFGQFFGWWCRWVTLVVANTSHWFQSSYYHGSSNCRGWPTSIAIITKWERMKMYHVSPFEQMSDSNPGRAYENSEEEANGCSFSSVRTASPSCFALGMDIT